MIGSSCSTKNANKHQAFYAYPDTGGKGSCDPYRVPEQFFSLGSSGMELLSYQNRDMSLNAVGGCGIGKASITNHPLSRQMDCLQLSIDHLSLLHSENLSTNPRPLCVLPPKNTPERVVRPYTISNTGKRISSSQADEAHVYPLPENRPVKFLKGSSSCQVSSRVNSSIPIVSNVKTETASSYSNASSPVGNNDHVESCHVPMIGYSLFTEGESTNLCRNDENSIIPKSQLSMEEKSSAAGYTSADIHSKAMIPSKEKAQSNITNRIRRSKIAEGIKALEKSVPFSAKGDKESMLDDVIDYIKFLKYQLKVLSQSHLCGEPSPYPFIHVEGYGHYFIHPQMSGEPFEELIGQLMEVSMQSANELLNSKGLTLLPMDFAYTLLQSS